MFAIWFLVPLPLWKPAYASGSSWFMYCWSLAWRILSISFLTWNELNCTVDWTPLGTEMKDKKQSCTRAAVWGMVAIRSFPKRCIVNQGKGPPQWLTGKESTCNAGDAGLMPGSGGSPGEGQPTPIFLGGESHGQRLEGYGPWGHKEAWLKPLNTVQIKVGALSFFFFLQFRIVLLCLVWKGRHKWSFPL